MGKMIWFGMKNCWVLVFAGVVLIGIESRAAEQKSFPEQKNIAAPAEESTCEGRGWEKINVKTSKYFKTSETNVPLTLASTKDGQSMLKWPNPDGKEVLVEFRKTKAPVTEEGDVEICSQALVVVQSGDSYPLPHSLPELQKLNLQPGNYAIRVKVGCMSPGCHYDFSNLIITQLGRPGRTSKESQ